MNQTNLPSPSLYVGDLHEDVNEALLYEVFSKVGSVVSANVCRDNVTKRSLGYAYVNFHNSVDAERALEALNYTQIKGKPIRIAWSKRDPSKRKSNVGNVFVKNLDASVDNKVLHDEFSKYGNISSCKLATNDVGESMGYGYIHFDTAKAASDAIEGMDGKTIGESVIQVTLFKSKSERGDSSNFTNLYVKNLWSDVTEEQLREIFSPFGDITSIYLKKDEEGNPSGVAFVNYKEHGDALAAQEELHEKELHEKKLYVQKAQKREQRSKELSDRFERQRLERNKRFQNLNVYVKSLADDIDDEKLRNLFAPFGTVSSAKVMRDENKKSKNFGFVCFSKPEEAQKAITEMNGKMVEDKKLFASFHQPREIRKMRLEARFNQRPVQGFRMQPQMQMQNQGYPQQVYFPPPQPGQMMPPNMMKGANRWAGQPEMRGGMQGMVFNKNQMPLPMNGKTRAFRFSSNARNREKVQQHPMQQAYPQYPPQMHHQMQMRGPPMQPQMRQPPMMNQPQHPQMGIQGAPGLNTSALSNASSTQKKQMIGDSLFPKVFERNPELAGKITGMLLDMDNSELLNLVEDEEALDARINEAIEVLQEYKPEGEGEAQDQAPPEAQEPQPEQSPNQEQEAPVADSEEKETPSS